MIVDPRDLVSRRVQWGQGHAVCWVDIVFLGADLTILIRKWKKLPEGEYKTK